VIPTLLDALREFGIRPLFVVLLLAAVLTVVVFLAQCVASWFDDRHS
jgi:hypothetical protein